MSVIAQHHGTCPNCLQPIIPGQRIETVDDAWEHVLCGETAQATTRCACQKCFLVHAPQQSGCDY